MIHQIHQNLHVAIAGQAGHRTIMATGNCPDIHRSATCIKDISLNHCREIVSITYCVPLNCVIVGDIDGQLHIVDAHSYEILKRITVAGNH